MFGRKRSRALALPAEPDIGSGRRSRTLKPSAPEAGLTDPTFETPHAKRRGWWGRRKQDPKAEPDIPALPAASGIDPVRPGEPTLVTPAPPPPPPPAPKRGWLFGRRRGEPAAVTSAATSADRSGTSDDTTEHVSKPSCDAPETVAGTASARPPEALPPGDTPSVPTVVTAADPEAATRILSDTTAGAKSPGLVESPGGIIAFLLVAPAAIAAYVLPLSLGLPLPGWLQSHVPAAVFALFFLLMFATLRLSESRWSERWAAGVALVALMLTGSLALGGVWAGGEGGRAIGGLLPHGADHDVFINALSVTEGGGLLFGAGWQASAAGPLATLLGATGQNLQAALAGFSFLGLLAAFLAALSVARSHGPGAGAMALAVLALFWHGQILGTTSAANGSFILGCCAFSLLWEAGRAQRPKLFAIGLFLLTLALALVGGAVLVVALLLIWGARRFGRAAGGASPGWMWLGGGVLAVFCGIAVHVCCNMLWGSPDSAPFGGLLTTLYGLAVGGSDPQALMADHRARFDPGMTPAASVELMARLTLDAMLADPTALVSGILLALRDFVLGLGWLAFANNLFVKLVLVVVALCGLWQAFRPGRRPSEELTAAGILGIVATAPVLDPDDLPGQAATLPFIAALSGLGVSLLFGRLLTVGSRPAQALTPPAGGLIAPVVVGLAMAAAVLPGPLLVRGMLPAAATTANPCADDRDSVRGRLTRGSAVSLLGREAPAAPDDPIWGRLPPVWVAEPIDGSPDTDAVTAPRLSAFVDSNWFRRMTGVGDRTEVRYLLDPTTGRKTVLLAAAPLLPPAGPDLHTLCGRDLGFHFELTSVP